jgi:hypothetical protein
MKRGEILGVTTYAMAKEFQKEDCSFSRHLNLTMPSETGACRRLRVDQQGSRPPRPGTTYRLRFFEQDSCPDRHYRISLQAVAGDGKTVVWETDVAADAALSCRAVVRSHSMLKGKAGATVSFRLYDKKGVNNFGIRVSVADLRASGFSIRNPDTREGTGWTFAKQGPGSALYGSHVCDPERQRHVFEAVRDLYGRVTSGDLRP